MVYLAILAPQACAQRKVVSEYNYQKAVDALFEDKDDDKSDTTTETDDNYYLYRTKVSKSSSADAGKAYEHLGLTKIKSRRTK